MNGVKYLVDTNCFIYLLDDNPLLLLPFVNDGWAYSYITEIELLTKKGITEHEEIIIKDLLDNCYKINHSQIITDSVISLRKNNNIKIPDAIIAASAQIFNLPLITADKGFARKKTLTVLY